MQAETKTIKTNWLAAAALIAFSILIALLLLEMFVRVFYPQRLYYNISQWDEYVGFRTIPNIESVQTNKEYTMHIKINSRGLRDREFPFEKPAKTIRIGVFGDSFTFGEGVEAEETYAKQLEQKFAEDSSLKNNGWKVEVLNFGIGKTGTSHQLAWYQKEGSKYGLDIVVLGFLAGNDFEDNLAGVFLLKNGELIHNPAAYSSVRKIQRILYSIPGYRWLAEHSHLANIIRVTGTKLDDKIRTKKKQTIVATPEVQPEVKKEQDTYAVDLTTNLIKRFASEAKSNHSHFLMLSFPMRGQKPYASYTKDENIGKIDMQLSQLQNALQKEGIAVIDFIPIFYVLPPADNYYKFDGHWRSAGHKVIAEELYQYLQNKMRTQKILPAA